MRHVLQSVIDCYYRVCQVLQSVIAMTKWDVTLEAGSEIHRIQLFFK